MDSKTQTRDGAVVARQTVNLSVLGSNPSREKPAGSKRTGFIAQMGERTTEDREVPGSIPGEAKPCGL